MKEALRGAAQSPICVARASVAAVSRAGLAGSPCWAGAFSGHRKDRRYYEVVEDTICRDFDFRYFIIRNGAGNICAIQPYFILDPNRPTG